MIVRAVKGERLVYEAREPRAGSRWHRVDLESFDGDGCCGCEHFQIRLLGKAREKQALGRERSRRLEPVHCKHLVAVYRRFARERLWDIVDELRRRYPDHTPSLHNKHD